MIPNVYKRKLDKYDPGMPIKFFVSLFVMVKKDLSSRLKLIRDRVSVMDMKKKKEP